MSTLAQIITKDALSQAMISAINLYRPKTILEIGSSDGTGSTRVIIDAIKGSGAKLYCIEMLDDRYDDLVKNTADFDFVYPVNCASVGVYGMFDRGYIEVFKQKRPDIDLWRMMKMEEIYLWYDNTVNHIPAKQIPDGIAYIKQTYNIEKFDMVLIDGSPFTAMEELMQVYGADVIVLDDTNDIKCYDCLMTLIEDTNYNCIQRDDKYRNGYAMFKNNSNASA